MRPGKGTTGAGPPQGSVAVVQKKSRQKEDETVQQFSSNNDFVGLYDFKRTIGKGHFGVVKLAEHALTKLQVAVKIIDKTRMDEETLQHLFSEVRCMKLLKHPNIVSLYEVAETPTQLFLILEYADGGDLYDHIIKHGKLKESEARRFFWQILSAVMFCHNLNIVHRDLKPENVLLTSVRAGSHGGGFMLKVSDFGMSTEMSPGDMMNTACGSLAYSAPEILVGDNYDGHAVDVWSLGVMLYMMTAGKLPFDEGNPSETVVRIIEGKYAQVPGMTVPLQQLIARMLTTDPTHRANLEEVKNSAWVQKHLPSDYEFVPKEQPLTAEEEGRVLNAMMAMNLDIEQLQADLAANRHTHLVATCKLLRHQQLRNKKLILSRQSSRSSSKTSVAHPSSTEDLSETIPSNSSEASLKRSRSVEGLATLNSAEAFLHNTNSSTLSSLCVGGGGLQRSNSVRDVHLSVRDRDMLGLVQLSPAMDSRYKLNPPGVTHGQTVPEPVFSPLTTQSVPEFIIGGQRTSYTDPDGDERTPIGISIGNILEDDAEDDEPDARNHCPRPIMRGVQHRNSLALLTAAIEGIDGSEGTSRQPTPEVSRPTTNQSTPFNAPDTAVAKPPNDVNDSTLASSRKSTHCCTVQ